MLVRRFIFLISLFAAAFVGAPRRVWGLRSSRDTGRRLSFTAVAQHFSRATAAHDASQASCQPRRRWHMMRETLKAARFAAGRRVIAWCYAMCCSKTCAARPISFADTPDENKLTVGATKESLRRD
jgi:hypothetical protein